MLTKDDLQAIAGVVKEEVKPINRRLNKLDKKIDLILSVLDSEIIDHELRITQLEERAVQHSPLN